MATTHKALAQMRALKDALDQRLSLTLTESFDASGNPCLLVGAAAAKATGCFIRIKPETSLQSDIIGNTQKVYAQHIVQVAFEANAEAGGADENDVNAWTVLLPVLGEVLSKGMKTEIWLETAATAPSVTTFDTASKKKATFEDLYNPLLSQQ